MATELAESPTLLRSIARRAAAGELREALMRASVVVRARATQLVLLTGMGSSYFAAHYGACLLEAAGSASVAFDCGDLLASHPVLRRQGGVRVVVSQSGRSAEILDLLDVWAGEGKKGATCLAVTNEPASPLGRTADILLELRAGVEEATSSKTYFGTLALVALLAGAVAEGEAAIPVALEAAADALGESVRAAPAPEALALCAHIEAGRNLVFLGKGTGWCAAQQGALIAQEAAHAVASAATYGQWRHGPSERASADVVLVAAPGDVGDPEVERTLAESAERGAVIVRLPGVGLPAWRRAFDPVYPVYGALLEMGRRSGREIGRLANKVTGR